MTEQKWLNTLEKIGPALEECGKRDEDNDKFCADNYTLLRENRFFSALVPSEFGGGGVSFETMCSLLKGIAGYHPSTALSLSMHSHVIATNRYNHEHGKPGQALLEKVGAGELILVSTGGTDWLASNGEMTKTDGGFLLSGMKHFASGSPGGDLLITSAPYEDPDLGWQVLHFPVPINAEGVTVLNNWRAMGMRATGSNSVKLENVFVPDAAIASKRPRGDYHVVWSAILPVALTLIMSVYLGIAESAARKAVARKRGESSDPATPYLLGEMENELAIARMSVESMVQIVDDLNYTADLETANEILKRKTIASKSTKAAVEKAVEACGGQGFMRGNGIECLLRDVQASSFHPLQEKRQLLFSGSVAMGLEPPAQAF